MTSDYTEQDQQLASEMGIALPASLSKMDEFYSIERERLEAQIVELTEHKNKAHARNHDLNRKLRRYELFFFVSLFLTGCGLMAFYSAATYFLKG